MNKQGVSSPTVSLESVILAAILENDEEREFVIVDIPNVFIQTTKPKKVGY